MPVLCGDIGGTNTRLAILEPESAALGRLPAMLASATLSSKNFATFDDAVAEFLGRQNIAVEMAGFGIAGPVLGRRCQATNLPWVVDAAELESRFGFKRVELKNDLEALAHGIPALGEDDFATLHEGEPFGVPKAGNAALIAAGTGLGQAGLYFDGHTHHPFATEGGHTDFAPRSEEEMALLRFLLRRHKRVSTERVASGPGLVTLYEFVLEKNGAVPEAEIAAAPPEAKAATISNAAQGGSCPNATEALDLFIGILGAEAGNLALKMMSLAGVYIGGGIPPKMLGKLREGKFREAFCAKGRMRPLLEAMPLKVILNDDTALYGAARCLTSIRA